jgi:hypothetical protein
VKNQAGAGAKNNMPENTIELIKPSGLGKEKRTKVELVSRQKIDLPGLEGDKYRLEIRHLGRQISLITKETAVRSGKKELENRSIIRVYRALRSKGYPVPDITRIVNIDGNSGLALSDMTENGQYDIWGLNDAVNDVDRDTIRNMNLSEGEQIQIRTLITELADRATADGFSFNWCHYHVRKHRQTGKLDTVIMDADVGILSKPSWTASPTPAKVKSTN